MPRKIATPLLKFYSTNNHYEIGVDEAGRGPMFGRLYVAGVILPKDDSFDHSLMKDSKKFTSEKKIREAADYIRANAIAWHITYIEPHRIDDINILQAVLGGMHDCCRACFNAVNTPAIVPSRDILCLIDGDRFNPFMTYDEENQAIVEIPHVTIEGGDNKYSAIAAASILAKVARDDYIAELCAQYPALDTQYSIGKNKGYGTTVHREGIATYGITQWHRRTFGMCQTAPLNMV
jgi:ribonuclease HII